MCIFNRLFIEPNYLSGVKVDFVVPWAFLSRYTICYRYATRYKIYSTYMLYAARYTVYNIQYGFTFQNFSGMF